MMNRAFLLSFVGFLLLSPSASAQDDKIIGGSNVTASERPWVVKIHRNGKGHCTGSLIAKQWVITAAHCFSRARAPYTDFTVGGSGDGLYTNLLRLPNIRSVFLHPNYRGPETTAQDIALIKLDKPIEVSETLAPIPLKNLSSVKLTSGPRASITAWGLTDARGTLPTQLQSITLPVRRVLERTDIPAYIQENPHFSKPGVLVMMKDGVTTCRGDSGAGWTMEIDKKPYLIGIHSAGDFCKSTAIGAEVSNSLLWIKTRMLLSGL